MGNEEKEMGPIFSVFVERFLSALHRGRDSIEVNAIATESLIIGIFSGVLSLSVDL